MPSLIDYLDGFNRKERYFVVRFAVGEAAAKTDGAFRQVVGDELGMQIPETARWWMDYHLDWLYAALVLATTPSRERYPSPGFGGTNADDPPINVNENQEDVDLLVAFEEGNVTHLVLLEAKADTGWTNKQIHSKGRRLRTIFPEGADSYPNAKPHFVLSSPRQSKSLDPVPLPEWMLKNDGSIAWVPLPVNRDWRSIERCDEQNRGSRTGQFWRVKHDRLPSYETTLGAALR